MEHLMNHADTPRRGPEGRENFSQKGFLRIAPDGPDQVRFSVTTFDGLSNVIVANLSRGGEASA